ncbi:MAG: hypothetical protein CMI52_01945 [Parcubacteria group bacterium]|nr:hypothetical protein [Parcubacteria group bacterium]
MSGSRARYAYEGTMDSDFKMSESVRADCGTIGFDPKNVHVGHMFDGHGRFITTIFSKDHGLLELDRVLTEEIMSVDEALHVREQIMACENLIDVTGLVAMQDHHDEEGFPHARLMISGQSWNVRSVRDAEILIDQAVAEEIIHRYFADQIIAQAKETGLQHSYLKIEDVGDGNCSLIIHDGSQTKTSGSFDHMYSTIVGGVVIGRISDVERDQLLQHLGELNSENKLHAGPNFTITQEDGQGKLKMGLDEDFAFFSLIEGRKALQMFTDEGFFHPDRAAALKEQLEALELPETLAAIKLCGTEDDEGSHAHVTDDMGDRSPMPIYSQNQLKLVLDMLKKSEELSEVSYQKLLVSEVAQQLPETDETDALVGALGNLATSLSNLMNM